MGFEIFFKYSPKALICDFEFAISPNFNFRSAIFDLGTEACRFLKSQIANAFVPQPQIANWKL